MEAVLQDMSIKYKNKIVASPLLMKDIYLDSIRNSPVIDFSTLHKDNSYLSTVFNMFRTDFMEGEAVKSLDYTITPPFLMKEGTNAYYQAVGMKKSKNDSLSLRTVTVFAMYDSEDKQFTWIAKILDQLDEWVRGAAFVNNRNFKNVSTKQADSLAVWFRTAYYDAKLEYYNKLADKLMKTHNLILFDIERDNNKFLRIYALADLGIKEPVYNKKLSGLYGTYHVLWRIMGSMFGGKKMNNEHNCAHYSSSLVFENTREHKPLSKTAIKKAYAVVKSNKWID